MEKRLHHLRSLSGKLVSQSYRFLSTSRIKKFEIFLICLEISAWKFREAANCWHPTICHEPKNCWHPTTYLVRDIGPIWFVTLEISGGCKLLASLTHRVTFSSRIDNFVTQVFHSVIFNKSCGTYQLFVLFSFIESCVDLVFTAQTKAPSLG